MTTPLHSTTMASPVGTLTLVAGRAGLRQVIWEADHTRRSDAQEAVPDDDHPVLVAARTQLAEYFAGARTTFDLPLDPQGTDFQRAVWFGLADIPYGETATYGEQAARLGDPNKARAVGAANGRNPLSIVLPCHRVIGSDGSLTGFAGGLPAKRLLLDLEQGIQTLA